MREKERERMRKNEKQGAIFESGVDRAVRLALEMLISNADEMTCSRKMRVAE